MNTDPEAEKIIIHPERIIHILLKHLMFLKNENAYFKNKAGLQLPENAISDSGDGSKILLEDISEIGDGSKPLLEGIPGKGDGSKPLLAGIPEMVEGSKPLLEGISEKEDGSKPLWGGISGKGNGEKGNNWLYPAFEKELIMALEHYIKIGNGQNTLFGFYADFVEAVAQKNDEAIKKKEAEKQLKLEDTHILPVEIPVDAISVETLSAAMREFLGKNVPRHLPKRIAFELLLLHNSGKATAAELRKVSELSEGGIAKHLPKMQRSGLIKKQPPLNYALTEKSKHILLKAFGVAKGKEK